MAPLQWYKRLRRQGKELKRHYTSAGWRGVIKVYGWKLILVVVIVYLVRDTILYILIPLLVGQTLWRALFG